MMGESSAGTRVNWWKYIAITTGAAILAVILLGWLLTALQWLGVIA